VAEVPSVPSGFFPKPFQTESRRLEVPSEKSSTSPMVFGQPIWMFHLPFHFVRDAQELKTQLFLSSSRLVRTAAAWAV
jgi:hypothetical protein